MSDALVSVTESAGVSRSSFGTLVDLLDAEPRFPSSAAATFGQLAAVKRDLAALELLTVRQARAAGLTWRQIGDLLGVTMQSAHQRFSKLM
jgi:hypothetical protein